MFFQRSLFAVLLLLGAAVAAAAQAGSSREPFVLELPGISTERYTRPIVRLADERVPRLKIRVLEPFASKISYGNIIVTLNGDGINRGCSKGRDMEGTVVECGPREDRLGGYQLLSGKNILELRARDRSDREYYASYLMMLGDRSAPQDRPALLAAQRFTGKKYAVIVGVSEYKYNDAGLRSLDFADDDARSIADFLRSPQGGGFLPNDIRLLIDRDASVGALRSALTDVANRARPDDLVLIFLAGHGAPDPLASQNLYFLFYDTKVVDMASTGFPMSELKLYLDTRVAAKRIFVMIDTCHSAGVNQKTKSLVAGRDLVLEGDENNISNFYVTKQLFNETGRAILTSSDVNEVSQESAKWNNHGVFTWALLEGLRGKADVNNDNFVTAGEVFDFTRRKVQAETQNKQNPIASPGAAANMALAMLTKGKNAHNQESSSGVDHSATLRSRVNGPRTK